MNKFGKFVFLMSLVWAPTVARAEHDHYRVPSPGGWYERGHWREHRDRHLGGPQWNNWNARPGRRHDPAHSAEWQIRQGLQSGRLSRDEARELREEARDLHRDERRYWSDGYLSRGEREDLHEEYRDFNRELRHELNDGERRSPYSGDWYYGRGRLK